MLKRIAGILLPCWLAVQPVRAQQPDLQKLMERMDRLEQQNQELLDEVRELRRQMLPQQTTATQAPDPGAPEVLEPAAPPSTSERLDVLESRTEELAQTKLGTSQRMPVSLTGMVLFNAFHNGGYGGTLQDPLTAQQAETPSTTGASFRQTVIGLKFNGPELPGGGKASGSVYFDFWGGTAAPNNNLFRLRLATLDLKWRNTTITVGQDKPIIAPREPMSLAQVGLAPLSAAGNLWDWQPQARIEQRMEFTDNTGLRAQAGVYETSEVLSSTVPATFALERQRPAYEGRFMFYHGSEGRRLEVAPGFHFSQSHVGGQSVASKLGTLDWFWKPANLIEVSGAFFRGENAAGLGGLRQGFTLLSPGLIRPVHVTGGWGQLAIFPASRLSAHIYGGEERDRASDLVAGNVRRNLVYAGNLIYKLAPNVLAALEASQTRTNYIASGLRLNNHYDLAFAYLF